MSGDDRTAPARRQDPALARLDDTHRRAGMFGDGDASLRAAAPSGTAPSGTAPSGTGRPRRLRVVRDSGPRPGDGGSAPGG